MTSEVTIPAGMTPAQPCVPTVSQPWPYPMMMVPPGTPMPAMPQPWAYMQQYPFTWPTVPIVTTTTTTQPEQPREQAVTSIVTAANVGDNLQNSAMFLQPNIGWENLSGELFEPLDHLPFPPLADALLNDLATPDFLASPTTTS